MTLHPNLLSDLRPRLYRYILKRVRDPHLAEDLLQDVLVKLHLHRDRLPDDERPRVLAWALRTAHNAIVDHFRAARRGDRSLASRLPLDAVQARHSSGRVAINLAGCARRMLARLPARYREALELADLRQHPQHRVARQLGISLSGAKSRVQRGRRHLRAMIAQCCDVELGRRGSVVSVVPTARARGYCGATSGVEESCVQSWGDASS